MSQQDRIAELLDKQDLLDLSIHYAMAADRQDRQLMESLWWPEATVDVGVYEGNALDYSVFITTPSEGLKRCHHAVSNPVFKLDGDRAKGQVYVNAASTMVVGDQEVHALVGGRYVDEYQRRDGVWKFLLRSFVIDWAYSFNSDEVWAGDLMTVFKYQGKPAGADFGQQFLASA